MVTIQDKSVQQQDSSLAKLAGNNDKKNREEKIIMETTQQLHALLENPEIFAINRLAPTSDHRYYPTLAQAVKGESMQWRHSLNGEWLVHYSENLAQRAIDFERLQAPLDGFAPVQVPGHLQLQGYGNPHYVNTQYPWDGHEELVPPFIPTKKNPTASYVKMFTVPTTWEQSQPVHITFAGVESACQVWLNGHYVGYSEDSFTPSSFDLTPYVNREGENKLAVQVYQYSSGSWLEDQDFWRLSGIFREVYLSTQPQAHLEDLFVTTPVINNYQDGIVNLEMKVTQAANVRASLVDAAGNVIGTTEVACDNLTATAQIFVPDANLWSAENPYLYDLRLEVFVADTCVEAVVQRVGIRQFEMINKVMHINGKRIVFRGVNRHEFSATHGRAVTNEEMEWDVKFLKANNFNAVRTSHYPNATYFYELCDEHGLYVMDETNLETHGTWQRMGVVDGNDVTIPNGRPEYLAIILDRAAAMLERDKNHPSILIWSCGNESFGGENLYLMSQYFRNRDASRLVHYEGVFWDRRFNETSDMESRMYAFVSDIREFLDNNPEKPFISCEYTHAMGNSNGGMDKYIALEDEYEMYQGGFIWDYIDQALWATNAQGERYLAFGGDFGDQPTDYNFCVNGIIYANREASPKMQAIKGAYQPFVITVAGSEVTIQNKLCFTNLSAYDVTWTAETADEVLATKTLQVELEPLTTASFDLGIDYPATNEEVVVTVTINERTDTYYAKAGHEIAFGQQVIAAQLQPQLQRDVQPFTIAEGDVNVGISGVDFEVIFARNLGRIVSLKYAGVQYIHQPNLSLMPSFWRAATDNDRGYQAPNQSAQWKIASLYAQHTRMQVTRLETGLQVDFEYNLNTMPAASVSVRYFIDSFGVIHVTMSYEGVAGLPEMFRFGMDLAIPAQFETLTWRGLGPMETYSDREFGAKYGTFTNKVSDNLAAYVIPQACGNHTQVKTAALTNAQGCGLLITGAQPLSVTALPYTCHELEAAFHHYELPPVHKTVVSINLVEMGVGGDDSWGAQPHPEYKVKADQDYTYQFSIQPVKK